MHSCEGLECFYFLCQVETWSMVNLSSCDAEGISKFNVSIISFAQNNV